MRLLKPRNAGTKQLPAESQGDGSVSHLPPEPLPELPEMTFLEHLEDLRWSIIKGLVSLFVITIVCSFFSTWIIDVILMGPAKANFFMYDFFGLEAREIYLQNRTITGQFFAHIGTVVAVGLVIGSPVLVFFIWKFIEPGLYPHEKKGMRFASLFATMFFVTGILFGYLVITPLALQFFAGYQISPQINNEFDITKYFNMIVLWALSAGLLFELPVILYFLAKLGIVTGDMLRKYRKYALIVILVLAAILTPPDPISQTLVAIPMLLLYEISIHLAAYVERKRARELKAALE